MYILRAILKYLISRISHLLGVHLDEFSKVFIVLRCSLLGVLRDFCFQGFNDVSGQPIGPIFKVQAKYLNYTFKF